MIRRSILVLRILALSSLSVISLARAEVPSSPEFNVPDDLRFELLLREPEVRQPVNISFDERGRLWVVQYLQYPSPAGLKMLSRDGVWRVQYDKVPPPPPHHIVVRQDYNLRRHRWRWPIQVSKDFCRGAQHRHFMLPRTWRRLGYQSAIPVVLSGSK